MIESQTELRLVSSILCDRTARQRSEINHEKIADIAGSIARQDLIHPILISTEGTLIAGEHRLLAFGWLASHRIHCNNPDYNNWTMIPVHYARDVTDREIHQLELEENIRRVALDWKDEAKAIKEYFDIRSESDPDWNYTKTAKALGISEQHANRAVNVARELAANNPKLAGASSIRSAATVIERQNERAINAELDNLLDLTKPPEAPAPTIFSDSILVQDFKAWWSTYSGPKFNFIHCDFPYGIDFNKGEQARDEAFGAYDDSPEVYWDLLGTLAAALPQIASPSCHMLFWFSMNYYWETLTTLEAMGFSVNPFPLIWHKTDNKGILPDPERGPRRVYETAFLCSLGDRKIVRAVSNTYGAPTSKQIHTSEKPESVLRHFFQMFIDEYSVVLDPTAGSASALRAAEALGAKQVLGLELNSEFAELANMELNKARRLREMTA